MTLLRRHDRYVLGAFASAFGAVMLFFTAVIVVMDLAERLARFLRYWDRLEAAGHAPAGLILEFYATLLPFVWMRLVPLAAPIAAALALARLLRHDELVALVSAGVSTRRILLPILLAGALLAGLLVVARETVVSPLNHRNASLGRLLTKRSPDRVHEVGHFEDAGGGRLSMAAYHPIARRIEDAILVFRGPDGEPLEVRRYPELAWDGEAGAWVAAQEGLRVPLGGPGGAIVRHPIPAGSRAPLAAPPSLLEISVGRGSALGLSFSESAALARAHPENPRLAVAHQEQFTLPLSTLVLLLLALPLCLDLERRGMLPGMLAALGVGALFFASGPLAAGLATTGELNPLVLAWLPTVAFGSLGLALYAGMRS